ncbi:30S ribosomal protein S6 [Mycoplasmoides pirum]|uniref:30S ribosomal protein S6 n=1 Tax=Mycoplasmoides pirum TaxID=2122 RepID=UPI000695C042|nr:30S ribosomal protein S6 [Mycoplasmoides pirum]
MSKYEIVVLLSSKLTVDEADKVLTDLNKNIKVENLESKFLGTWELAYPINNETLAHYYQINFDGEGNSFVDWKRLVLINKSVLRHLIINLSKDYGARASENEKKLRISVSRKIKYDEIMNNPDYVAPKQGPQIIVKKKRKDEWTLVTRIGANGPEDITVKNPKFKKSKFAELPEYKIPSKRVPNSTSENEIISESKNTKIDLEIKTPKVEENVVEKSTLKIDEFVTQKNIKNEVDDKKHHSKISHQSVSNNNAKKEHHIKKDKKSTNSFESKNDVKKKDHVISKPSKEIKTNKLTKTVVKKDTKQIKEDKKEVSKISTPKKVILKPVSSKVSKTKVTDNAKKTTTKKPVTANSKKEVSKKPIASNKKKETSIEKTITKKLVKNKPTTAKKKK